MQINLDDTWLSSLEVFRPHRGLYVSAMLILLLIVTVKDAQF